MYVWSEPPGDDVLNLKVPDLSGFGLQLVQTPVHFTFFTVYLRSLNTEEEEMKPLWPVLQLTGSKTDKKHSCRFPACFTLCRQSYRTDSDGWLQKRN